MSALTHRLHGREQLGRIPRELRQHRKWEQCGSWQETDLTSEPYLAIPGWALGALFSGAGQERVQQPYIQKKKEKGLLMPPEIKSHQKAIRTREAVTRRKRQRKGQRKHGQLEGMGECDSKLG